MALYERLVGFENPKIPVHQFMALLAERRRGQVTNQQVVDALGLDPAERTELLALVTRVQADTLTAIEIHDVLMLAEAGWAPYGSVAAVKARFGV